MSQRYLPWILIFLSGCGPRFHQPGDEGPLPVEVSLPIEREVRDKEEFTGRLDAVFSLDVKPQVTGKLLTMPFKEGTEIKKGDLLFEIDPEQYQAQVDISKADVQLMKAKLILAQADNKRAKKIRVDNPAAISQQDLDKYDAAEKEAAAAVDSSSSKLTYADINLKWCKIKSDIDGQISRYYLTTGNLVNQNTTLLTTVVSVDPIYAYFDVDERTLLRARDAIAKGRIKEPQPGQIEVFIGLTNEQGFPHEGLVNFVNNKVDPLTGTITVRGVFKNPKGPKGPRLMSPGMFVRILLPLSDPYSALLVAEKVILTDQGMKFVYIVDESNKVIKQPVTAGASQPDGFKVVTGIKKTDRIAVSNLQQLREDLVVNPDKIPMETVPVPGRREGGTGRTVP